MEEYRIKRRRTTWYVINVKARRNQFPNHYVDIFRQIKEKDPLVEVYGKKCISVRSLEESELLENDGTPRWMKLAIMHYTIVDPNAFYNIREHKDVNLQWNTDIVANKNEAELYFVPSVHKIAVKCNSKISLNNILRYLREVFESVEPEGFDVTIVLDHDMIQRILTAHSILSFEAKISYSNPGHTEGFSELFENKMHVMNPDIFMMSAVGTKDNPLVKDDDGIIHTVTRLAEENGSLKATVIENEGGGRVKIDSKDHPRILAIPEIINGICSTIYNALKSYFSNYES